MADILPRENLHKAHRARVKERFLRNGLENFSPHELLELILFYAIPQKDTNELAHRLIDRFGSLSRVFRASREELCRIDGVGDHAATLLCLWMQASSYILTDEYHQARKKFSTVGQLGRFFIDRYVGNGTETVYLMLLDNGYTMIDCVRVHEGAVNSVSITPRRLIELALRQDAAMVVLAHNHPTGIAIPSREDMDTTASLRDAFETVGVPLLEHILVAGEAYTPIILRTQKHLGKLKAGHGFYSDYTLLKDEE